KNCFSSLGYNVMSSYCAEQSAYLKTVILSFLNRDDAYGFYLACHGMSTIGNDPFLYDTDGTTHIWEIRPSEIHGNWKFVFLDGCYTGQTALWANAFNIYNTSVNRAFLGWDQSVQGQYVIPFSYYLFDEIVDQIHSNNIRDAAVWAASQIENDPHSPETPTTPIRFYGDRTYDGRV
ncbi:MAG: hypothetical protein IKZ19_01010, partial [Clostridia bacterium]|nr:hypothetical protein [Clostridia bacterium]